MRQSFITNMIIMNINQTIKLPASIHVDLTHHLPPHDTDWDGILLATSNSLPEIEHFENMLSAWRPLVGIHFLPISYPRSQQSACHQHLTKNLGYPAMMFSVQHTDLDGGMTTTQTFVHIARLGVQFDVQSLAPSHQYPRTLQTALDDTQGAQSGPILAPLPLQDGVRPTRGSLVRYTYLVPIITSHCTMRMASALT